MATASPSTTPAEQSDRALDSSGPAQDDVERVRDLLDLMTGFSDDEQRARYLLSSDWMRERGGAAAARARVQSSSASGWSRSAEERWEWQAPALTPVFVPCGERPWEDSPCPWWCRDAEAGHDLDPTVMRTHVSRSLLVRAERGRRFYTEHDMGDDGVSFAHVEVRLQQSVELAQPSIRVIPWAGNRTHNGGESGAGCSLYLQEARELIAALQFVLKVAQDGVE